MFSPQGEVLVKIESSSVSSAQDAVVRTSMITYTTPKQKYIYISYLKVTDVDLKMVIEIFDLKNIQGYNGTL